MASASKYKQRIRQDVLQRHGLVARKHGKLEPKSEPSRRVRPTIAGLDLDGDPRKTLTMRLIEAQLGIPIEELLTGSSLGVLKRELGLDKSTISKWKKKLGIIEGDEAPKVTLTTYD